MSFVGSKKYLIRLRMLSFPLIFLLFTSCSIQEGVESTFTQERIKQNFEDSSKQSLGSTKGILIPYKKILGDENWEKICFYPPYGSFCPKESREIGLFRKCLRVLDENESGMTIHNNKKIISVVIKRKFFDLYNEKARCCSLNENTKFKFKKGKANKKVYLDILE